MNFYFHFYVMDKNVYVQEYDDEGRRSRRLSSPCNSREGSTTALHTQHYDDAVSHIIFLYSCYEKTFLKPYIFIYFLRKYGIVFLYRHAYIMLLTEHKLYNDIDIL